MIENFRPGTLERWNLGYDRLSEVNPGLVLTRVTGFGQFGPRSKEPAFGTIAEAMSRLRALHRPARRPADPPAAGLADNISGLAATIATLMALRGRDSTGKGQVVDLAIIEPILAMLGSQLTVFDQLGDRHPARRQPLGEQRPAQHLQDRRRPLGRDLHQRPVDRRAGDAPGRS